MSIKSSSFYPELNTVDSKFYLDKNAENFESFYFNLFKTKVYPKGAKFKKASSILCKLLDDIIKPIFIDIVEGTVIHRIIIEKFNEINMDSSIKNRGLKVIKFKNTLKYYMELLLSKTYEFINKLRKDDGIIISYKKINEKINVTDFCILLENYLNISYNNLLYEGIKPDNTAIISQTNKLSANTDLNVVFKHFYYQLLLSQIHKLPKSSINTQINTFMLYMFIRFVIDKIKNPKEPIKKSSKNNSVFSTFNSVSNSSFYIDDNDDDEEPKFKLLIKTIYPRDVYINEYYIMVYPVFDSIFISIFDKLMNNEEFINDLLNQIIAVYNNPRYNDNSKLKAFKAIMKKINNYLFDYAGEFILKLNKNSKIKVTLNKDNNVGEVDKKITLEQFKIFLTNLLNMRFNKKLQFKNRQGQKDIILDNRLSAKTNLNIVYKQFYYKLEKFDVNGLLIQDSNGNYEGIDTLKIYTKEIIIYLLSRILIYLINKKSQMSKRLATFRRY